MNCPTCGAESAASARFCSSCGQALRSVGDERRVVTVLFADLVGFTTLSEQLDPEQVKRLVDHAFERLVRDVTSFGGRVDKIIGDAIVALFGAPVAHEDDAERAVRAALRMHQTLDSYARERGVEIRMRIGVNTGEVLVGALRAGGDYTAMGDVVNTASRLQSMADPGEVLVGEATHAATSETIRYDSRGAIVARGREQPVDVWAAQGALLPPGYRPRRRESPLVGRDAEMAILTNSVHVSLRHHRAQVLLLLGEAGVGKTRLANELAAVVDAEDDIATFSGRCVPYGEANPWWPIAEALRSGCGVDRADGIDVARERTAEAVAAVCGGSADVGDQTSVVNGLLHLMGYEGPLRDLDGTRARTEATQALLSFLEASVRRKPMMVRLADLHWADQAVLDLIDELSVHLARQPLVFVATARRSLQQRWSPSAGRFNSLVLNLDPLDRTASAELLDSLAGAELDAQTRSALLDRSGGNPFYLEELVTLVGSRPPLTGTRAGTGSPGGPATLPDTLRGLVAARIDALSPEEQQLLEDASVWGPSGPLAVIERIAEAVHGVNDVGPVLQSLVDKDVMVGEGGEWSFRSDLVREVAYARLTKRERMLRHAGIATYMEHAVAGPYADDGLVDTVARHFVEAARLVADLGPTAGHDDLAERAVRWAAEAARRAEEGAVWPQAQSLYSQALELVAAEDTTQRLRFLLGRSRVRAERWDDAGAREDAMAAMELAEEMDDAAARAQALLRLSGASARAGDWRRADEEVSRALELFDAVGDSRGRAEALRQRGMAYLLSGDQRSAEEPIAAALDAFRAVGDRRGEAWSLQNLAWIAFTDGRVERAERFVEASERAFREAGDSGGLAWVQGLAAFVRFQQGDFESARDIAGRILRESERRGDRFGEGMMHVVLASVELWTGHPREAAVGAQQAVDSFRQANDAVGLEQALALAGRAAVMAGDTTLGWDLLDQAASSASEEPSMASMVRLFTDVQVGRPDSVLALDRHAWVDGPGSGPGDSQRLAVLALALAQAAREQEALPLARDAVSRSPDGGFERATLALVAAACGEVAEAERSAGTTQALRGATYLDRVMADMAVALVDPGVEGDRALGAARRELAPGEDAVATAMVALAAAVRAEAGDAGVDEDRAAAERAEADRALGALGLGDTRWRDLFRRVAGRAVRA